MGKFDDITLPRYKSDDRQSFFNSAVGEITEDTENAVAADTMEGFSASAPDVGFLQDTIKLLIEDGRIESWDDLSDFLNYAVQRVKALSLFTTGGGVLNVVFKTKDDKGWYAYNFGITLPAGLKIQDVRHMPAGQDVGLFSGQWFDKQKMTGATAVRK